MEIARASETAVYLAASKAVYLAASKAAPWAVERAVEREQSTVAS